MGLFWGVSLRFAVWCCSGFGEEEEEEEERLTLRSLCFLFRLGGEAFGVSSSFISHLALQSGCFLDLVFVKSITGYGPCSYCTLSISHGACQEATKHQNTGRSVPLAGGYLNGESSLLDPLRRRKQHCPECHARKQRDPVGDADFVRMYIRYSMYKWIQKR